MTKPFSVIFAGTPDFAVPSLEALVQDERFTVELVITQPDRPVGRKQVLTPPPVKLCAEKYGIPVAQPQNINEFAMPAADYLIVVAYGQLLKQHVLDIPEIAPVNVHGSLLPRWRGAAPIQAAILAGDTETGVTIQKIVAALDAGDILAQASTPISTDETSEQLYQKLSEMGANLLVETLAKPLEPTVQDASQVTVCKKLTRQDGVVDPSTMTAEDIHRKVRALVPWPGVTCEVEGKQMKLLQTHLQNTDKAIALSCAKNTTLYITKYQEPGKKTVAL